MILSSSVNAMDKYSSADKGVKTFIDKALESLNAPDTNTVKNDIYDAISFIFDEGTIWNSYWLGYNELSSSKIENPDIGFVEFIVNTGKSGIYFVSFLHDPHAKQILLNRKQIRYGDKSAAFAVFEEKKEDTDEYKVIHERDNYALLQQKGKVNFSAFNLSGSEGAIVYFNQTLIDYN